MKIQAILDIEILVHNIQCLAKLPGDIVKELTFDVYLLSCKTKNVTYIKSRSVGINSYFIERMCGKDATITKMKSIYIWELRKFVEQQDAVLIDIHKSFIHFFDGGVLMSSWVRQVMDIDKPMEDIIKLKNCELNKVYKYSYEVTKDPDALKFFYEKMHAPHIKKKFGTVEKFIYFKKFFRDGELLFVKLNGERVSAVMCKINKDGYYTQNNGVIDESFIKGGALLATYYFSIIRGKEINAKIVDFGLSRPFLSDGVLRHKNQWGAKICEYKTTKRFIYLKNILFEQPFIFINNGKLKAAMFSENDKFMKEFAGSGLEFDIMQR